MKKFARDIITIYDLQFLRYGVRQAELFVIFGHFLFFYHEPPRPPLMILKIKILKKKKKKKIPGDIILLYIQVYHK